MNYSQLRAFHTVASLGSFTQAAAALHLTQPTLSDHVKGLEQRYNVKLFERSGRGVKLTSLGRALLDITRQQFRLEAQAEQLLSAAQGLASGHLRVAADGPYLIIPLLGTFQRRNPGIRLSINFGNSEWVLRELLSLRSDIGVLPAIDADKRFHAMPILCDQLVVFVERGHVWARRRGVRLTELKDRTLILREAGSTTRAVFERALSQADMAPVDRIELGSREAVREAVAAGLGVGICAQSELSNDERFHALIIRDGNLKVVEHAVCLVENRPMPVVNAFFRLLKDEPSARA